MKRSTLVGSMTACLCLALTAPLLAAQPATTSTESHPSSSEAKASAIKPAEKCLADLRAFDSHMEKDGYWLGGSGYGYGYPMGGVGYGYGLRWVAPGGDCDRVPERTAGLRGSNTGCLRQHFRPTRPTGAM